jgi:hypothetical protein
MLVSGNGTGNHACYLIYKTSGNGLYLTSDAGTSQIGPVSPGGSGTLSNTQCSVAASSVSVSSSGNILTITETSKFSTSFAGEKTTQMYTYNNANVGSGWSTVGSWTVPGATAAPVFSVFPASGSGATQAFSFTFTSTAGAAAIAQGHMLFTGNGTGNNACYLIYKASNKGLYLTSDNGGSLIGPVTPGGSGSLSNSQCSVAGSSVSVNSSGNSLKVNQTVVFKTGFNGNKSTMMYMFNNAGVGTGWSSVGTWTVPGATVLAAPFAVSPDAGSGAAQVFVYTFTSPAGAASIGQGHMLITGNGTGNNACYLIYKTATKGLYLTSDNGASLAGPVSPGGSGTLSNSQCSIAASTVSVTSSGNSLKVTQTTSFKGAFKGSKNIMMYMFNTSGAGTGWTTLGNWTVTAAP